YIKIIKKFKIISEVLESYYQPDQEGIIRKAKIDLEQLYISMKEYPTCPSNSPIYQIWNALIYDLERISRLKHHNMEDYLSGINQSKLSQCSGLFMKIMKEASCNMAKLPSF